MAEEPTFESVVVDRGLVTPAQLEECQAIRRKVAEAGLETSIDEVLVKKGHLTRQQVSAVQATLGKGPRAVIEGYTIQEKIAQGGMGAVYRARQSSMDRMVAIKILLPKFAKEKGAVDRFLREAKAIAKLSHPNIVAGIDAGFTNGLYYYVMEFIDGESMDKIVRRDGALHWSQALPVIRQVAAALDHAHAQGLVHRDIKPGNILVTKDGVAKLADLGLVRMASGDDIYVTQTGVIMGTPAYISPEQARSDRAMDTRSDIYSLGITLFEFLDGRPPYESDNALVVVTKHTTADVPVDRLLARGVPPEVCLIVRTMCARDKRQRYQSPAQLLADLDAALAGRPLVNAQPPPRTDAAAPALYRPPPERRWVGKLLGVASGLLVLAIAVTIAYVALKTTHELPSLPGPVRPPPGPTDLERRADEAWDAARLFESTQPARMEEVLERYRKALDAAAGTKHETRARDKTVEWTQRLADAMKKADAEADRTIADAELGGRWRDALEAATKAAGRFSSEEWNKAYALRAQQVLGRARAAVDAKISQADALAQSRSYDAALARLVPPGIPELDTLVERKRAEIVARRDTPPPPPPDDRALDASRLGDAVPRIMDLARRREFDAATKAADALVDELRTLDGKAEAQRYRTWLATTSKFVRGVGESLSRLRVGEKITVDLRGAGRVEGTVVSSSATSVTLRLSEERQILLTELSADSLVALYERPIDGRSAPADRRAPALLSILVADAEAAARYMDLVTRAGYEVPGEVMAEFRKLRK
jgi:serine/threonine-protein kinase